DVSHRSGYRPLQKTHPLWPHHDIERPRPHGLLAEREFRQGDASLPRPQARLPRVNCDVASRGDPDGPIELRGRDLGSELSEGRTLEEIADHRPSLQHELPTRQPEGEGLELDPSLGQVPGHERIEFSLTDKDGVLTAGLASVP